MENKIFIRRKAIIVTDHKMTRSEKKAVKAILKGKLDKFPVIVFPVK